MPLNKPLSECVSVDDERDVVTIYGIKYSGACFRGLGFSIDEKKYFQILERKDGVLIIHETYAEYMEQEHAA